MISTDLQGGLEGELKVDLQVDLESDACSPPKLASEREGQAANSRRSGCNVEVEDSPPDQVELDGQPA